METNSWKYEEGEYNLHELCKKHHPPVIVQCCHEIGEVTVDNTTIDLSKPILLFSQRNINKVTAKIIHREIYREVGPPLLIPEDYKGWFAVLQKKQIKPGTLRQDILEFKLVADLSNSNTQTFLIGGTEKVQALQVTTFSDGKYQHQQRSLFPGEVLRRGKIYIGERRRKSAIFRRHKMKQDYYLLCTDECDREILLPFTQKGLFYTITTENGRMSCPVLQMKDILDKKYLPATVKLLYGKLPNLSCEFTDTLRLEDSNFERSVIACTVSDENNFLELPLTFSLKFRIFDMNETIISSAVYRRAFGTCNEKVHLYMRSMKVCHDFGELKVMSEEGKLDNEIPPAPHILRKRKPLDIELDDNRESGYIEMRPESFEFTKDYLYTDMSNDGIPDSEIDLDDMDYVRPSANNTDLYDYSSHNYSATKSSKVPVIGRNQSFSLPPPTTPPPPLPHACSGTLPRTFHTYFELDSGLSDNHMPSGSLFRSRSRIEKAHTDQIYDIPRIPKRQSAPDVFESFQTNVLSIDSMPILSESSHGEAIKYENFSILREVVPQPCGKNRISQRKQAEPAQYDSPQYDSPQNLDVVRTRSCNIHNFSSDSESCSADSQYFFEELNSSDLEVHSKRKFETRTETDFCDNSFDENEANIHAGIDKVQNENEICESEPVNPNNENENKHTCDEPPTEIDITDEFSINIVNNDNASSDIKISHDRSSSQTLVPDEDNGENETEVKVDMTGSSGALSQTKDVENDDIGRVLSHTNDIENSETLLPDRTLNSNSILSVSDLNDTNIEILAPSNDGGASKDEFCEDKCNHPIFLPPHNDINDSLFKDDTSTNASDINLHKIFPDKVAIDVQNDNNKSLDANIGNIPEPNIENIDNSSELLDDKICTAIDISLEEQCHNNQQYIDTTELNDQKRSFDSDLDVNACLPDAYVNLDDTVSNVNLNNCEGDLIDEIGMNLAETVRFSFDRLDSIEDQHSIDAPPPCTALNKISKETLKAKTELNKNIGEIEISDNQGEDMRNNETVVNQDQEIAHIENSNNTSADKGNIETVDNKVVDVRNIEYMDNQGAIVETVDNQGADITNSETLGNQDANIGNIEIVDIQDDIIGKYENVDNEGTSTGFFTNETLIEIMEDDENPYVNTNTCKNNEPVLNEMVDVNPTEHCFNENMDSQHLATTSKETSETRVFDSYDFQKEIGSNNEQSNALLEIKSSDFVSNHVNSEKYEDINSMSRLQTENINPGSDQRRNDIEIKLDVTATKDSTNDYQDCLGIDLYGNTNKALFDEPLEWQNNSGFVQTKDSNKTEPEITVRKSPDNDNNLGTISDSMPSNEMMNSDENRKSWDENQLSIMSTDDIVNEFRKLGVRKNVINFVRDNNLNGVNFKNVQKLSEILPGVSVIDKRKISIFLRTALSTKITNQPKKTDHDPLEPLWV